MVVPFKTTTFRWYNHLKKQAQSALDIAIQNGKQKKQETKDRQEKTTRTRSTSTRSFNQIRASLDHLYAQFQELVERNAFLEQHVGELEEMVAILRERNHQLAKERDEWKGKWESLDPRRRMIEEDYKLILQILNRAREHALLEDERKMLSRIQNGAADHDEESEEPTQ